MFYFTARKRSHSHRRKSHSHKRKSHRRKSHSKRRHSHKRKSHSKRRRSHRRKSHSHKRRYGLKRRRSHRRKSHSKRRKSHKRKSHSKRRKSHRRKSHSHKRRKISKKYARSLARRYRTPSVCHSYSKDNCGMNPNCSYRRSYLHDGQRVKGKCVSRKNFRRRAVYQGPLGPGMNYETGYKR